MATILKSFDFGGSRGDGYNWEELLDGQCRQLTKGEGEDYNCKNSTFGTLARNAAKKANKSVRLSTVKDGEEEIGIVIQAFPAKEGAAAAETDTPDQEPEVETPAEEPAKPTKKPAAKKKAAGK